VDTCAQKAMGIAHLVCPLLIGFSSFLLKPGK